MEYELATKTVLEGENSTTDGRRSRYRYLVRSLAYVNLDHANGGIIRDLSEAGMAIQAVSPLRENQPVHLRFELLNPRVRLEVAGRITWAEPSGQCGVEFLNIPHRSERLLRDWIFIQLLGNAQQLSSTASMFDVPPHKKVSQPAEDFPVRKSPKAQTPKTQTLTSEKLNVGDPQQKVSELFETISLSANNFARIVDGTVLLSALLLFFVVALSMTHVVPQWPLSIALGIGAAVLFAVVYWFLFVVWNGATPGAHLAILSYRELDEEVLKRPRFR
ncbi:MAG: hypothetical protein NVS1B11_04580 [Terriglobales bacterium]